MAYAHCRDLPSRRTNDSAWLTLLSGPVFLVGDLLQGAVRGLLARRARNQAAWPDDASLPARPLREARNRKYMPEDAVQPVLGAIWVRASRPAPPASSDTSS